MNHKVPISSSVFERPELSVQKNLSAVQTVWAIRSKKFVSCSNGSSYLFKKICQPFKRFELSVQVSCSNGSCYPFKKKNCQSHWPSSKGQCQNKHIHELIIHDSYWHPRLRRRENPSLFISFCKCTRNGPFVTLHGKTVTKVNTRMWHSSYMLAWFWHDTLILCIFICAQARTMEQVVNTAIQKR